MNATMIDTAKKQERICSNCNSLFLPTNSRHEFCSTNCRVANYRAEQSRTLVKQDKMVEQQKVEIEALKAIPVTRTKSVQEINPDWQLAKQEYQAQQATCHDLNQQLSALQYRLNERNKAGIGTYMGVGIGAAFVFIVSATRYDDRQHKPLGVTFPVAASILLIILCLTGYYFGKHVDKEIVNKNKYTSDELTEITNASNELNEQVAINKIKLEELKVNMVKIPQYKRETVTSIDETREIITD